MVCVVLVTAFTTPRGHDPVATVTPPVSASHGGHGAHGASWSTRRSRPATTATAIAAEARWLDTWPPDSESAGAAIGNGCEGSASIQVVRATAGGRRLSTPLGRAGGQKKMGTTSPASPELLASCDSSTIINLLFYNSVRAIHGHLDGVANVDKLRAIPHSNRKGHSKVSNHAIKLILEQNNCLWVA